MLFKHEELKKRIGFLHREIKLCKRALDDKDKMQFSSVVWQVATEGELIILDITKRGSDDLYTDLGNTSVRFKIDGLSQFQFEDILDEFDSMLEVEGFTLDTDWSRFCDWSRSYDFKYCNSEGNTIAIEFSSKTCKQVETGKMVPEKKNVCSLFAA